MEKILYSVINLNICFKKLVSPNIFEIILLPFRRKKVNFGLYFSGEPGVWVHFCEFQKVLWYFLIWYNEDGWVISLIFENTGWYPFRKVPTPLPATFSFIIFYLYCTCVTYCNVLSEILIYHFIYIVVFQLQDIFNLIKSD